MTIQRVATIFDDQVRPDTTGIYCRRALRGLVEVQHFLPEDLHRIPRSGFDLYLNIDDGLNYRLPPDLKPCAWWAIDTHLNLDWCQKRAQDFDFVFAAQRDGATALQQSGIASACWLPLACDPEVHRKFDVDKTWDVCFVGNIFPGLRADLLELLRSRFPNHFIGRRFFEEMARTYSASRVVFNRSLKNDVNMRVFEALSCGSLLVTNDLADNGLADLFQDGVHLATYRDADELVDKINYYLSHQEAREKIASQGRGEVLAKDTYRHRMAWLLGEVEWKLAKTTISLAKDLVVDQPLVVEPDQETAALAPTISESTESETTLGSASPVSGLQEASGTYYRQELVALVPPSAQKILVLGPGISSLAAAIRQRQPAEVVALEFPAQGQWDGPQAENLSAESVASGFDLIVLGDLLEHLRNPRRLLRWLRSLLGPEGHLIASVPNVRHHAILRGLLDGNWGSAPAFGPDDITAFADPVRFFTRRELEKLIYRSAWHLTALSFTPGSGAAEWAQAGRPGEVRAGRLHIGGLSPDVAAEFYADRFLVTAVPGPVGEFGATSIIILTHNQLAFTKQCVDSIRRYTDELYDLIFVDNASTDGTVEYLRTLPHAKVILNDENRGFPAAANQGIQEADGFQILLLNNDVVVTTGWLRRLLQALYSGDHVGLAGPCSNWVSGPQQVPAGYEDLNGLDGFAWDWAKANAGIRVDTDRLVGFCLLMRREVIRRIGYLDERFGIGNFEDDDFCRRALQAGFRAVIARDAYIHHFGGQTFRNSGVDFAALMQHNEQLFRDKWKNEPTDVRSAGSPPTGLSDQPQAQVRYAMRVAPGGGLLLARQEILLSVCIIARDNARTIGACLKSIKPWVDEMVLVDTGSKDDTPNIAEQLGARVFHFPWCDSFSAARNESLRHARGSWIFWMDTDDTIDENNGRRLRALAESQHDPTVLGYGVQVHCPGAGENGPDNLTVVDHIKLFPNRPDLRFEGRIHEQIIPSIRRAGGEIALTDIFVVHSGYDHSPAGQQKKLERDLHLLHLELAEQPNHPFTLFNLGMTHADQRNFSAAAGYLQRSLAHSGPAESHLRKVYALLVYCYSQMRQPQQAWQVCREGLGRFPEDAELRFRQAQLLYDAGRLKESAQVYEELLRTEEAPHFKSVDPAIKGYKTRQNLAVVYADMGDFAKAEEQWWRIVHDVPRYRPAWRGLGEVLLRQGKVEQAQSVADRLLADPRWRGEGHFLNSQIAQAHGRKEEARRELERAIAECPADGEVWQAWCRFLFEQGQPAEAEAALRELLRRDPHDAAAHHNLGTIWMRLGRSVEAAEAYRQSLRLRPDASGTWRQLATALDSTGHSYEAQAARERAHELEIICPAPFQALCQGQSRLNGHHHNGAGHVPLPALAEANYQLRLRDRITEVRCLTRGPVDRAILRDLWDRDVYQVRDLPAPATVLDIGAHIGAFSLLAAEAWPQARVIACEADPENFTLLEQNLQGRPNVETVPAAIVAEDVADVTFHAVADKVRSNSGGGSCQRPEPDSVPMRVPAQSIIKLWHTKGLDSCDLLKLDCEASEFQILQAMAEAGLLPKVRHVVGEWHADKAGRESREGVQNRLREVFAPTHEVIFQRHPEGRERREGHFSARALPRS